MRLLYVNIVDLSINKKEQLGLEFVCSTGIYSRIEKTELFDEQIGNGELENIENNLE